MNEFPNKKKLKQNNENKDNSNKPKLINKYIELHFHLDGSITVDIAKKLASLQNIVLPTDNDSELESLLSVPDNIHNLEDIFKCFALPLSLLQTPKGLTEAVRLVADNIQSLGVIYVEFRFAPQLHTNKGMTQEDAIKAALEGIKLTSLKVNLILCIMRGKDNQAKNELTLELAKKYLVKDGGVVAIDLAGDELNYKTCEYKSLFEKAREYKIPFTIHAGEVDGPESIKAAIEFGAKRIGHGVRACEDQNIIELLRVKEIPLEICPISNKITQAIGNMVNYPVMDFLLKGLKVTLSTDDMGIERTNIIKEFNYLEQNFNLTYEQKKTILINSINAAFTTDEVKAKLRDVLGF